MKKNLYIFVSKLLSCNMVNKLNLANMIINYNYHIKKKLYFIELII